MLELVVPTLAVLGFFGFVGLSVRGLLAIAGAAVPSGWWTLVGLGLGTALPIVTAAHLLRWELQTVTVGLAVASAAVLGTVLVLQRRGRGASGDARASVLVRPDATDLAALGIGVLALLPMLRFGATSWSIGANDGPNYFASAQIWLSGDGSGSAFVEKHADFFGEFQVARAAFEKPMVTSLYAAADVVSGMPVYRLLTPVLLVALLVLANGELRLLARVFGLAIPWAVICTVPPFMSVVFVSRLHNAQVGQVVTVALLAQFLLLATTLTEQRGRFPFLPVVVTGVAGAAALGASATVALAAAPSVLAGAYLILRRCGARPRQGTTLLGAAGGVALVASAAFMPWYLESLALQAPGIPGLHIADDSPFGGLVLQGTALGLPSPLAVVGLEPPHDAIAAISVVALAGWSVLAGLMIVLLYGLFRSSREPSRTLLACAVVVAANGMLIAFLDGLGGYGLYKWAGVVIPLLVPLALAKGIVALRTSGLDLRWPARVGAVVVVVSTTLAIAGGFRVGTRGYVASHDLLALADDPVLQSADHVNIDTGIWTDDAMAAVVVPSSSVTVTRRTYPRGAAAEGELFLVGPGGDRYGGASAEQETFVVVRREAPTVPVVLDFGATTRHDRLVLGDGYRPVASPWVSTANYSTITLDGARLMRDWGCLTLVGRPAADPSSPLDLTVTVSGFTVGMERFTSEDPVTLEYRVPPLERGSRVNVELETDALYTRGSLGYVEDRAAGFGLRRLALRPGPCLE